MDDRAYRQTTTTMPATVATHQGRWRNRIMPLVVTMCRQVTWQGVGDVEQVRQILTPVAAIGKKRAQGEGRVLAWHIEPTDGDPWEFGHLQPVGGFGEQGDDHGVGVAAVDGVDQGGQQVGEVRGGGCTPGFGGSAAPAWSRHRRASSPQLPTIIEPEC